MSLIMSNIRPTLGAVVILDLIDVIYIFVCMFGFLVYVLCPLCRIPAWGFQCNVFREPDFHLLALVCVHFCACCVEICLNLHCDKVLHNQLFSDDPGLCDVLMQIE